MSALRKNKVRVDWLGQQAMLLAHDDAIAAPAARAQCPNPSAARETVAAIRDDPR
ncbi:hypothetical protein RBA41_02625 [Massilia sp. CCM 9210]|uniref:hypothetical protein n=1 Tax=Massilia scottii TaxID=3057166 RepID=UPI002796ADD2|nr:hypothetical protein [Massilia sp. CCM 9210]MDQ1812188.1 hypothetical protein [Massilia sp. CCM 9210]